jgi:hypothetical protein
MDYLSELLESYSKLKKRTFKLTYICEQDDPEAEGALTKILQNAPQTPGYEQSIEDPNYPGLKSFKYRKTADGGVSVLSPKDGQATVLDSGGNRATVNAKGQPNKAGDKMWERLFQAMSGKGDEPSASDQVGDNIEAQQQQAEAERLSKLAQPGGAFEERGYNLKQIAPALDSIDNSIKTVQSSCEQYDPQNQPKYCKNPGVYLTGASKAGFAHKLSAGKVVQVNPETGQKTGEGEMEPGLLNSVAQSHDALMDFLGGEGDCDTITQKVGFYKNRMVIFGSDTSEGVTITPNALQDDAINKVKDKCGADTNLNEIAEDNLSTNAINAVKGTFNELVLQLGVRLLSAKDEASRQQAFKEVAAEIDKRRQFLTEYAESLNVQDDVALGLDESFEREVLTQQAGIAQSNTALKNWFLKELSFQMAFVNAAGADNVEPAGREIKTGGREDTNLIYNDQARAEEAAKKFGSKAVKRDDGTFAVGIGQKRIEKLKKVKLGEINSTERMMAIMTGEARNDANMEPGFQKRISSMQFGNDQARENAAIEYMKNQEAKIAKLTKPLTEFTTYVGQDGKIKSESPETRLKGIAARVKGLLGYNALKDSALGKALFKGDKGYQDFGDESTQQRAAEVVAREARFKQLKDDIESGDQAAQDAAVKMALICGANANNMTQVFTDDSGETYAIPHNKVFEEVCKANSSGNLQVKVSGTTMTMTTPDGLEISFNQEGTWGGGTRRTRSNTRISPDTIKRLNTLTKQTAESTLHKFLEGQMKLLQEILNSSK